jgi:hypothetical protein
MKTAARHHPPLHIQPPPRHVIAGQSNCILTPCPPHHAPSSRRERVRPRTPEQGSTAHAAAASPFFAAPPFFDSSRRATSKAAVSRCLLQTLTSVCYSPQPPLITTPPCPRAGPRRCAAAVLHSITSCANARDAGQAVPFYTRNYQEVDHGLGTGSFGKVKPAPPLQRHHCSGAHAAHSSNRFTQFAADSTGQPAMGCCCPLLTDRAGGCMR